MDKRLDFTLSLESRLIYDRIVKVAVGDLLTYEEIATKIVHKPFAGVRSALASARRRALREQGMVFGVIRGEAIQRLSDTETVHRAANHQQKIRRAVRRGLQELVPVQYEQLSERDKSTYNARFSIYGALDVMTSTPGIKRVEAGVVQAQRNLDISETLRLFGVGE